MQNYTFLNQRFIRTGENNCTLTGKTHLSDLIIPQNPSGNNRWFGSDLMAVNQTFELRQKDYISETRGSQFIVWPPRIPDALLVISSHGAILSHLSIFLLRGVP